MLVVPPDHPLAGRGPVADRRGARRAAARPARGGLRHARRRRSSSLGRADAGAAGAPRRRVRGGEHGGARRRAVRAGLGVAFVSDLAVTRRAGGGDARGRAGGGCERPRAFFLVDPAGGLPRAGRARLRELVLAEAPPTRRASRAEHAVAVRDARGLPCPTGPRAGADWPGSTDHGEGDDGGRRRSREVPGEAAAREARARGGARARRASRWTWCSSAAGRRDWPGRSGSPSSCQARRGAARRGRDRRAREGRGARPAQPLGRHREPARAAAALPRPGGRRASAAHAGDGREGLHAHRRRRRARSPRRRP